METNTLLANAHSRRRITLVLARNAAPLRRWNDRDPQGPRIIFVRDLRVLQYAIRSMRDFEADVERIILDHSATAPEFLAMLAHLPQDFQGDVININEHSSFFSAQSRGDGRQLWQVTRDDVEYYLQLQDLTLDLHEASARRKDPGTRGAQIREERGLPRNFAVAESGRQSNPTATGQMAAISWRS